MSILKKFIEKFCKIGDDLKILILEIPKILVALNICEKRLLSIDE